MKIALSYAGQYVCAEGGGDELGVVHVNRAAIGPWETWTVEKVGAGQIALRSASGRYLCAEGGGGGEVHANRHAVGPWETFTANVFDGAISLHTSDGAHYLSVDVTSVPPTLTAQALTPVTFAMTILEPDAPRVRPIHVDGLDFRDDQDHRWLWRGASDFLLYQRFLARENISDLLTERIAAGANLLRVLGMVDWGPLRPREHPDYYDQLGPFADRLAEAGCYLEFVAFADAQLVMPSLSDQRTHWGRVADALRGKPNVFLELVNEFPKNGINPTDFSHPGGVLCSRGSGLGDGMPARPPWDYTTFHSRRDYPKLLLDAQPIELIYGWVGFEGFRQPVVGDEPIGADEVDEPGRRSNDPALFWRLGVLHGLWNGGTFHSTDGVQSVRWGPVQRACAEAFFAGLGAAVRP